MLETKNLKSFPFQVGEAGLNTLLINNGRPSVSYWTNKYANIPYQKLIDNIYNSIRKILFCNIR